MGNYLIADPSNLGNFMIADTPGGRVLRDTGSTAAVGAATNGLAEGLAQGVADPAGGGGAGVMAVRFEQGGEFGGQGGRGEHQLGEPFIVVAMAACAQ